VLVVLFAAWCRECRREIPSLDRIVAAYADTDLRVFALALDEDAAGYRPLAVPRLALSPMRLEPFDQDALVAAIGALGGHYHRSIPYVAVLDRSGALVRDRWTEGRRLEDVSQTLSSLYPTHVALPR
jgi:thiol-disulfide isomerase/thioredoxin